MEVSESPLIQTKLRAPAVRQRFISRANLLSRHAPEASTDLVLVCAPAGYGKSTLLAEWAQSLRQNGSETVWYSLDAGDNDPIRFGSYLIAGFCQAFVPTAELENAAQQVRSSSEIDLQRTLAAVINAVLSSDRTCVLIMDDYHLVSAPVIHTAVAYLLEHLPENMFVILGSRSDPPLPLARMRARGQLLEIRAADLCFTQDETARFMNEVMRLDLSPEMIDILDQRTEGWVTGLQLAALTLANRTDKESFISSFTGSHRYLVEYLFDEVFTRQSVNVQSFLLSTSILERMCAPLCDAILGESSRSEAILGQLDQANLFVVALDDEDYWYRYHHLFGNFLQTRLHKELPERVITLHMAASQWLAAHGYLHEAAEHAFRLARQFQNWDFAAAFVEQHGFTMIIHSEISTLSEWCAVFPEEVIQAHPMLCIFQCWPWVFRFQNRYRDRVEERLRQAEHSLLKLEDRQAVSELREHAAVVRTFLAMAPNPAADPQGQLALAQSVLGNYPEGDPSQFSTLLTIGYCHLALHDIQAAAKTLETAQQIALRGRLYFGVVESGFHLARLAYSRGQLSRSAEICRQGQADIASVLVHPEQELPALGCLNIALGCVYLEQDRLEEAERNLLQGLELIGWGTNPYYQLAACVALFRLRQIQGRSTEAAAYLTRLEEVWPDIAFFTQALRILHTLRIAPDNPGTLPEAAAWSQAFSDSTWGKSPPTGLGPFGAVEVYYLANLAWAQIQVAVGQPRTAMAYLERELTLAVAHGLANRVIELSLVEAQAAQAEGDDKRTWAALERALAAAQPEGYVRIFDQGPALTQLLVEAANRGIYRETIGRILTATGGSKAPEKAGQGVGAPTGAGIYLDYGEHLSDRELQVLHLMAQGATNQAIATQLVITVGTVKSHLNHIFGKLSVHNRTEAVARAREFGLLAR